MTTTAAYEALVRAQSAQPTYWWPLTDAEPQNGLTELIAGNTAHGGVGTDPSFLSDSVALATADGDLYTTDTWDSSGWGYFTVAMWVKPQSFPAGLAEACNTQQVTQATAFDRLIYLDDSGRINFGCWKSGANNLLTSTAAVPLNQWSFIACVCASTGMSIYLNGELVASNAIANPETQNFTAYWCFGAVDDPSNNWGAKLGTPTAPGFVPLTGDLAHILAYDVALPAATIAALYVVPPTDVHLAAAVVPAVVPSGGSVRNLGPVGVELPTLHPGVLPSPSVLGGLPLGAPVSPEFIRQATAI